MLGIHVPYIFCLGSKKITEEDEEEEKKAAGYSILRNTMKDFFKLENVDKETQDAIMNFSFYLTCGNLDDAYNAVRNIQNISVW